MIRQEDSWAVLILYHEVFEVVPSSFTLKLAEHQEGLVHVVWIHHTDFVDYFSLQDVLICNAKRQTIVKLSRLIRNISKISSNRRKNTFEGHVST
jgi:hypothetical protein